MEVKISISSKKYDEIKINNKHKIYSSEILKVKKISDTKKMPKSVNTDNSKIRMNLHKNKVIIEELPEISNKLIDMGYSIEVIKYLFGRYKFNSFDQAIWILGTDPETQKYNHFFYQQASTENKSNQISKSLCQICDDVFDKHENCYENINGDCNFNESHFKLLSDFENSKDNDALLNLKNKNRQVQIKTEYIKKLEEEFTNDNLCIICYENEILPESSFSLDCKHLFCQNCVKTYLETGISAGNIKNLKCLQAGCKYVYREELIQKFVSQNIFHRYLVMKTREETKHQLQKGFIPCAYPDCQDLLIYKDGNNPLVFCKNKHRFCAICKGEWHSSTNCKNINIQAVMKSSNKIRMCPQCNMFIEKEDGCNHVTCEICDYEFCWLCLKKYEFYHYYAFNIQGCPGLRNAKTNKSSFSDNQCLNLLWYFLVIILFILAIGVLVVIFFFFGAGYEFVKCYRNSKKKKDERSDAKESHGDDSNASSSHSDMQNTSITNKTKLFSTWVDILIVILLIILGILVQPFFLMFKALEMMMECYRNYGCLFFWFLWGGNTN